MKHLRKLSVVGALLFAPWLGFSSIANAAQPVCQCWSAEGLLAALMPVITNGDVTVGAGARCDTIPGHEAGVDGPEFTAKVVGGGKWVRVCHPVCDPGGYN